LQTYVAGDINCLVIEVK